ncbi:hypothetical protein [Streptomyces sp. NL15-2K]|uniref:hypothetical protein n=1 Tax=Streptomyces sp. NL15-2K TaxID=376149 RepID=UPI000F55F2BD|nr:MULTISPECIES: hypothetical protein [Actinomycetes]WKX12768.1 hypothetical protein Q4V64_36705 [Kutzneria buriramensis]GCB51416.1 hypothetical protein SNL152K_8772 [Streptomyces sp. NL15-2K]
MRYPRFASVTFAAVGLVCVLGGTATAAPTPTAGQDPARSCGAVRLSGSLPVPPAGMSVRQTITIGEDCELKTGPVHQVPASAAAESPARGIAAAPSAGRQLRSWNEMYDCCGIRMTGLYSTADWSTADGRVSTAATTATQEWNREPWNAGWSLKSATDKQDCATDCAVVNHEAHADFTYQGIFDTSGDRYANTHHSSVQLAGDGTADCAFDVELKNTFIGWNWQHGCE